MNVRNETIRIVLAYVGAGATGVAIGAAASWICTAASLGVFLTFLVWLLALVLSYYAGALVGQLTHKAACAALPDARLDAWRAKGSGLSSKLRGLFA